MENNVPRKTGKPWGFELLFAHTSRYAGKVLSIKKGHRLSLQYHKKKDESMYICEGNVFIEVIYPNGRHIQTTAMAGDCFQIPRMTKHRLKANEDALIFEVSTPELDDVERLEDDYGRS